MTFKDAKITHLLIICPRGFANERSVYPIPASLVERAEALAHRANPEGYCDRTRCQPLSECCADDRKSAGYAFRQWDNLREYTEFLIDEKGL